MVSCLSEQKAQGIKSATHKKHLQTIRSLVIFSLTPATYISDEMLCNFLYFLEEIRMITIHLHIVPFLIVTSPAGNMWELTNYSLTFLPELHLPVLIGAKYLQVTCFISGGTSLCASISSGNKMKPVGKVESSFHILACITAHPLSSVVKTASLFVKAKYL